MRVYGHLSHHRYGDLYRITIYASRSINPRDILRAAHPRFAYS